MPCRPSGFASGFPVQPIEYDLPGSLVSWPEDHTPPQHDVAQYLESQLPMLDDWLPQPAIEVSPESTSCSPSSDSAWSDVDEPFHSFEPFDGRTGLDQFWGFKEYDYRIREHKPNQYVRCTPRYPSMIAVEADAAMTIDSSSALYHSFGGGWQPPISISIETSPVMSFGNGATKSEDEDTEGSSNSRYICKQCLIDFTTSHDLESHAKTTGHRAYVCGCGSTYHRRDSYLRHLKTHRDTSLHNCRVCEQIGKERAFKRKDHLLQHIRGQHPETPVCDGVGSGTRLHSRSSCS